MNNYNTRHLLKNSSNEDLEFLVKTVTESWNSSLDRTKKYKVFHPDHRRYASELYDEICLYGGNTIVNWIRGEGPDYFDIVKDVASTLKVENPEEDLILLERQIIAKAIEKVISKLSDTDKNNFLEEIRDKNIGDNIIRKLQSLTGVTLIMYLVSNPIILQNVLRGVIRLSTKMIWPTVAIFGASRFMSVLGGPIGWIIGGTWAAFDISSPAKRITIPCVIHIACLRLELMTLETVEELINQA